MPIMFGALPIGLQDIDSYAQVRSPGRFGRHWPTELRAQLTHTTSPFRLISGDVAQLFARDTTAHV